MGGTITNPVLKTDFKQAAGSLADDLKQQATDFAKAKIDSTKKGSYQRRKRYYRLAKKAGGSNGRRRIEKTIVWKRHQQAEQC